MVAFQGCAQPLATSQMFAVCSGCGCPLSPGGGNATATATWDEAVFGGGSMSEPMNSRETEICRLVLDGMTSKEIGRALGLSHRTVECYRERIIRKAGTRSPRVWMEILERKETAA